MDDDLYDEFGNFIGEDVEASEEESEHGVEVGNYAYDEYAEAASEAPAEEHMDIDGMCVVRLWDSMRWCTAADLRLQMKGRRTLLFCTRTSSTIRPPRKCTERASRRWYRRRMRNP